MIRQLEFEGVSHDDAQWAVDHLTIDWNEQALQKANSYRLRMNLPHANIRRLLASEVFSAEQIDYAMTTLDNYKLTKKGASRCPYVAPYIVAIFYTQEKSRFDAFIRTKW